MLATSCLPPRWGANLRPEGIQYGWSLLCEWRDRRPSSLDYSRMAKLPRYSSLVSHSYRIPLGIITHFSQLSLFYSPSILSAPRSEIPKNQNRTEGQKKFRSIVCSILKSKKHLVNNREFLLPSLKNKTLIRSILRKKNLKNRQNELLKSCFSLSSVVEVNKTQRLSSAIDKI